MLLSTPYKFNIQSKTDQIIHNKGIVIKQAVPRYGELLWSEKPLIHIFFSVPSEELTNLIRLDPSPKPSSTLQQQYKNFCQTNQDILTPGCYIFKMKKHFKVTTFLTEIKLYQLQSEQNKTILPYWIYEGATQQLPKQKPSQTADSKTSPPSIHMELPIDQWQLVYQFYQQNLTLQKLNQYDMKSTWVNHKEVEKYMKLIALVFIDMPSIIGSTIQNYVGVEMVDQEWTSEERQSIKKNLEIILTSFPRAKDNIFKVMSRLNSLRTRLMNPFTYETTGYALYRYNCFLNHSCNPNAVLKYDMYGNAYIYSLRPIKAGEEVTISYCPNISYDSVEVRRKMVGTKELQDSLCMCPICMLEDELNVLEETETIQEDADYTNEQKYIYQQLILPQESSPESEIENAYLSKDPLAAKTRKDLLKTSKEKIAKITTLYNQFPYMTNWKAWCSPDERDEIIRQELKFESAEEFYRIAESSFNSKDAQNRYDPTSLITTWYLVRKLRSSVLTWVKTSITVTALRMFSSYGWKRTCHILQTTNNDATFLDLFYWLLDCYNYSIHSPVRLSYPPISLPILECTDNWHCQTPVERIDRNYVLTLIDHIYVEVALLSFLDEWKERLHFSDDYVQCMITKLEQSKWKQFRDLLYPIQQLKTPRISNTDLYAILTDSNKK